MRGGELGHFGPEADVGDLLQFPPQALLPLGPAPSTDLVPGLAGVQLGGQVGSPAGVRATESTSDKICQPVGHLGV